MYCAGKVTSAQDSGAGGSVGVAAMRVVVGVAWVCVPDVPTSVVVRLQPAASNAASSRTSCPTVAVRFLQMLPVKGASLCLDAEILDICDPDFVARVSLFPQVWCRLYLYTRMSAEFLDCIST